MTAENALGRQTAPRHHIIGLHLQWSLAVAISRTGGTLTATHGARVAATSSTRSPLSPRYIIYGIIKGVSVKALLYTEAAV